MAARRKSTKKTTGTAAPKQKTTSVSTATRKRSTAGKTRSTEKGGKLAAKPKKKPVRSKDVRKRSGATAGSQSATRSRSKGGEADVDQGEGFGQSQQDWGSRESKSFVGEQAQLKASGSEIAIEERPER